METEALASAPDGYEALRRYMHAAVGLGVGVLNLIRPLLDDPDWTEQRARTTTLLDAILERGKEDERALAHRQLDIYIDGLGTPTFRAGSTVRNRGQGHRSTDP